MGVFLNEEEAPVDVSGYTGITFWVKGDGQRYRMEFISENITDFCYYGYTFKTTDEWTEVNIPFRFLLQETWGEAKGKTASLKGVTAIKFQTRGQPLDSFELYLDEINFYTEE